MVRCTHIGVRDVCIEHFGRHVVRCAHHCLHTPDASWVSFAEPEVDELQLSILVSWLKNKVFQPASYGWMDKWDVWKIQTCLRCIDPLILTLNRGAWRPSCGSNPPPAPSAWIKTLPSAKCSVFTPCVYAWFLTAKQDNLCRSIYMQETHLLSVKCFRNEIVKQLSAAADLHHECDGRLVLICLQDFDDVGVVKLGKECDFLPHISQCRSPHSFFGNSFNSHLLSGHSVPPLVHCTCHACAQGFPPTFFVEIPEIFLLYLTSNWCLHTVWSRLSFVMLQVVLFLLLQEEKTWYHHGERKQMLLYVVCRHTKTSLFKTCNGKKNASTLKQVSSKKYNGDLRFLWISRVLVFFLKRHLPLSLQTVRKTAVKAS